jgi:hypothetical protein
MRISRRADAYVLHLPGPRRLALGAIVAVPMVFNAVALIPELAYAVPNPNDDAQHLLDVRDASDALARGDNPIDFWVPEVEMGFPDFLYYQHLPHLAVVSLGRLTLGIVSLRTLFDFSRYLLLVGFPLTVLWSMRRMGFSDVASAVGAAASSLLSDGFRYGFAYDSYIWRGFGLFTQLWAMHLSFVAVAMLQRVAARGSGVVVAALASAVLVLSHLFYAYLIALGAVVLLVLAPRSVSVRVRLGRFALVGALAAVISSYEWLPFITGSAYVHISPVLDRYKYDSFGAQTIIGWLVTGELLDHGRVPVLTSLLAAGIAASVWKRDRVGIAALGLFGVWLVLYFGRPTLGGLLDLLPGHDGLFLHRLSGPVDLAAILLIGAGGAWVWELLSARRPSARPWLFAGAAILLFAPLLGERWSFYGQNASWMEQTASALRADSDIREVITLLRGQASGRIYAGAFQNWGRVMNFGLPFNSVRVFNLLADERLDALAPSYRDVSFNEDLVLAFDDQDLAHYRLFNIAYVIAPPSVALPPSLEALKRTPRYVLYRVPSGGYAEFAQIAGAATPSTGAELFEDELAWLRGGGATRWAFIRYDYPASGAAFSPIADCPAPTITYVHPQPSRFDVLASCPSDSAMVLKLTYHPNWHVTIDGAETATFMVSPSYIGFRLPRGTHLIVAEYRPTPSKGPLIIIGLIATVGSLFFASRDRLAPRSSATRISPHSILGPERQETS